MPGWGTLVATTTAWGLGVPTTAAAATLAHVLGPSAVHRAAHRWARTLLALAGVHLEVEGRPPAPPYLVMANHTSRLDIVALIAALPADHRVGFLAKHTLFDVPLLGGAMRRLGCVPVDREDRLTAAAMLSTSAERLRAGQVLVVFPEETWSTDGRLLPLKRGGFLLARRAGVPILPVGVRGALEAMPASRLVVTPGRIHVCIGTSIPPEELADRHSVTAWVAAEIDRLRGA
jgi:1-acyl-sn-glycerol-3-phosphate acyltransferase